MFNMTLLLYYFLSIVIISMSSLSRAFREKRCKVTTFFSFPQTFCSKFCCRPSGASRPPPDDRFLKSECKVTPFVRNRQIFSPLFSIKIPNKSAIAWESTPAEHKKKSRSPSNDNDLKKKRYIKYYYMTPRSRRRSCQAHAERIVSSIGVSAFQPRTSFA